MYNWNVVYVKYCDGGSYAGDISVSLHSSPPEDAAAKTIDSNASLNVLRNTTVDPTEKMSTIHFRGKHNRDGTIHHLLHSSGMNAASDIVIGGCSAGALGVFLGLDAMAGQIKEYFRMNPLNITSPSTSTTTSTPSISTTTSTLTPHTSQEITSSEHSQSLSSPVVVGFADSGFFMAHTGDKQWRTRRKPSNTGTGGTGTGGSTISAHPQPLEISIHEAIVDGAMDYQRAMRGVYKFMNISSGASSKCVRAEGSGDRYDDTYKITQSPLRLLTAPILAQIAFFHNTLLRTSRPLCSRNNLSSTSGKYGIL